MTRLDWRSWFASTGAPPAWGLVRYAVVGCAIALVATYLLWPRDRESTEGIPAPAT